jgi:hypothetical protein
LLNCGFLTNLNISYFLLATVLIASSLGLPNPHPDLVPIQHDILYHNVHPSDPGCDPGWTLQLVFCVDSNTIGFWCFQPNPHRLVTKTSLCPPKSECIGQGPNEAINRVITTSCVPRSNRIDWITKLKNALTQQCRCFAFTSANLGIALDNNNLSMVSDDATLGTLNVQVAHTSSVTYPLMPQDAQLYYQGASYPIQSIEQQDMEMEYGSFVFNAVFDPTQPLELCVDVSIQINFALAFVPYDSNSQDPEAEAQVCPGSN